MILGFPFHNGRQDSLSNIVSDIYGYEDQYYIFPKDTVDKATNDLLELYKDVPDPIITSQFIKALVKGEMTLKVLDAPTIVFRTISKFKHFFEPDRFCSVSFQRWFSYYIFKEIKYSRNTIFLSFRRFQCSWFE